MARPLPVAVHAATPPEFGAAVAGRGGRLRTKIRAAAPASLHTGGRTVKSRASRIARSGLVSAFLSAAADR